MGDQFYGGYVYIFVYKNVTFCDASYLTLAEKNETKLVTADENICNKAPDITALLKEFKY